MQLQSSQILPNFPDFVPFSNVPRNVYEPYIQSFDPYSDFGYTSLYAWGRDGEQYISQLNGNIVISMQDYMSDDRVLTFIGNQKLLDTADRLLEYSRQHEEYANKLCLIPSFIATELEGDGRTVSEDVDNHDYIFSTQNFISLEGHCFSHLRRKLSQFTHDTENCNVVAYEAELHDPLTKEKILDLSRAWAGMGTEGSSTADEEIGAIQRLLDDISTLNSNKNIHCLLFDIDGKMAGFCIFEVQHEFATVHFIKADISHPGSSDYVMVQTMRHILNQHGIKKVNHEQDLGIAGLRAAKQHYCPSGFLKKYTVSK